MKNRPQIESKKRSQTKHAIKTTKKQDLSHFVGPLVDFRSIWGPQGDPKIDDLGPGPLVVIPAGTNLGAF